MERPERAEQYELEPLKPPDQEAGREERGEEEGLAGEGVVGKEMG